MRILCIGDIYGTLGMQALRDYLPKVKQTYKPHLIIANGENAHKGHGITFSEYKEMMSLGIALVTLGNHAFRYDKIREFIDKSNIIRPANYDISVPGKGYQTIRFNEKTVTVINLMGRIFMGDPLDNPFKVIDEILEKVNSDIVLIDFHGEATSEKIAFAHYVDGKVTAVFGTHTHVQTNDAMTLPKGTLYITDLGMTGPLHGILGAQVESQINKFFTGMRGPVKELTEGKKQFNGVLIDTDLKKIDTISIRE
jgi:metallophosphoesterase (TIGR00282 family)